MGLNPLIHTLGFPRIGAQRELKKAVEAYWKGRISPVELYDVGHALRRRHWLAQRDAGIDLIPSNDFSFYDHVLDTSCLVGNVPPRFAWQGKLVDTDTAFAMARGVRPCATTGTPAVECLPETAGPASACEMTKWFDTNYHYIVPEFAPDTQFALSSAKPFGEFSEALALGIKTKPVLLGPVTYLTLGKVVDPAHRQFDRFSLLERLLPVYRQTLHKLADLGAEWVQLDEPALALDLSPAQRRAFSTAYAELAAAEPRVRLVLATYFGGLRDNLPLCFDLPVDAIHLDFVRAPGEFDTVIREFPKKKILSMGVIDGRNVWRTDYAAIHPKIKKAITILSAERVWLAPSCSLLHVPVTLRQETKLDDELRSWLAFAEEKLGELAELRALANGTAGAGIWEHNQGIVAARRASRRIHRDAVQKRLQLVEPAMLNRHSPFAIRRDKQRARFRLPTFPTTTIGSFPQTETVRAARAQWKKSQLGTGAYEAFLEHEIADCVRFQEEAGLDVLVHGEFERNDMVEYFGEQLEGFAFTQHGWVQSYGSRCVKPPIIYGDVAREGPMTVRWARFAQALTARPMKGMLTGPVTILQWSFVRDDQLRRDTAWQIALALRDEVADLERAGIGIVQIDEPALREGLPLRLEDWKYYLTWAVDAFRLCAAGAADDTQIHTHMCYAEFNDIVESIARMDADVITIEAARSGMDILRAFDDFVYPNEIGPGVWDIHSPRVPPSEEMESLLAKAAEAIPAEHLWVNPDCGLKTRSWPETKAALANMVEAAHRRRWHAADVPECARR